MQKFNDQPDDDGTMKKHFDWHNNELFAQIVIRGLLLQLHYKTVFRILSVRMGLKKGVPKDSKKQNVNGTTSVE